MPEIRIPPSQLRVARLASSMVCVAGLLWLVVVVLQPLASSLPAAYSIWKGVAAAATIAYLTVLAVKHWQLSRSPPPAGATQLTLCGAMNLAMLLAAGWLWFRGASSRLLLAQGSDLLAVITVVLTMQLLWQVCQWWFMENPRRSAATATTGRTLRLLTWLEPVAGSLLITAWIVLELQALPHTG